MWKILQHDKPEDFVIATGEQFTVREFVSWAFDHVGRSLRWENTGKDEIGIEITTGTIRVKIDERYHRPAEVETLLGEALRAQELLDWKPKTSTRELLKEMMDHDLELARKEKHLKDNGF